VSVDEFVKLAKLAGWIVTRDDKAWQSFPFCSYEAVRRVTVMRPLRRNDSATTRAYGRDRYVFEALPSRKYKTRYLTEMRKHNEKVFALLKEMEDMKAIAPVLEFCT
jgi:hypothetical protein